MRHANEIDLGQTIDRLGNLIFVINLFIPPENGASLALVNSLSGLDRHIADWFQARLTPVFGALLRMLSEPGSSAWIGIVLFVFVLFFILKRRWPSLLTLVVAVPGGMLLNEWLKILVQRERPLLEGPFVDWSGYSFASGHTIGATLLYGQLALFLLPAIKSRHCRRLIILAAVILVMSVGFSRIALGAHFLTDVLAAIFFGICWLACCLVAGKPIGRRFAPVEAPLAVTAERLRQ